MLNDLRLELKVCHAFLAEGDTLVVPSLDRYGSSLKDLVTMVGEPRERGVGFTSLHENLDTTTPGGASDLPRLRRTRGIHRELTVAATNEGLAAARARGRTGGRPSVITPELLRAARDMLPNPENSIESLAKLLGVSAGTLYNHIRDPRELRAFRVQRQLESSTS